jgi:hypothetical protein
MARAGKQQEMRSGRGQNVQGTKAQVIAKTVGSLGRFQVAE